MNHKVNGLVQEWSIPASTFNREKRYGGELTAKKRTQEMAFRFVLTRRHALLAAVLQAASWMPLAIACPEQIDSTFGDQGYLIGAAIAPSGYPAQLHSLSDGRFMTILSGQKGAASFSARGARTNLLLLPENQVADLQPDGSRYVATNCKMLSLTTDEVTITRLRADGSADPEFGTRGSVTFTAAGCAAALRKTAVGHLWVLIEGFGWNYTSQIVKISARGVEEFVMGGPPGQPMPNAAILRNLSPELLAVAANGDAIVASSQTPSFGGLLPSCSFIAQLARIGIAGDVKWIKQSCAFLPKSVAVDSDDRSYLVRSGVYTNGGQAAIDRFKADGTPDPVGMDANAVPIPEVVVPDGNVLYVIGRNTPVVASQPSTRGLAIRLKANGRLDDTFGVGSLCRFDTPMSGFSAGVLQADGKVLLGGTDATQRGSIVRLNKTARQNEPYSGVWWGGPQENGWGLHLRQKGGSMVGGWYVFGADGKATYYILQGGTWSADNRTFTGPLIQPVGGAPFSSYDPARFVPGPVRGTLSFGIVDANNARIDYTIDGVTAAKTVSRLRFSAPEVARDVNYADVWWGGPAENGWGLALVQQYQTLAGAWYTFDAAGKPIWYVLNGGGWIDANTFQGPLITATGAQVVGAEYNAAQLGTFGAGTMTLKFSGADTATMTYTVGGVTQTKTISRFAF